jgi:anaerobic dimethyl sulfoxide reductase subunit A
MTEKNFLTKTMTDTVLSRRSFLKWSAVLGGATALAGSLDYGLKTIEAGAQTTGEAGKWTPVACWHNCGGRCLNVALVNDGVVIRQKTDDTHTDSPNYPQQRGCGRGRSQRRQVFSADRIKYPMKRKNWASGGGNKELRGRDEWVRISWDEALDIVASELKRIKETYGNKAILGSAGRLLSMYGGAVGTWGQVSYGAWPMVTQCMRGASMAGNNDRMDYLNSKLIVQWGNNTAVSSGGDPTYNYLHAKRAGAKFIYVTPMLNPTAMAMADEWIPCRPSTDAALLIGMAHYMITNNLQDQEFLDKYCVGFDAEHMPEGADPKGNFKDYVLGTYDGVPKTPEWASEICGTPPETIKNFAQEIATTKPMVFSGGWAIGRNYIGEQICQAFLTVGLMTGNVGKPGAAVCTVSHSGASYGGSRLVRGGGSGLDRIANPIPGFTFGVNDPTKPGYSIVWDEVWDAVLTGQFTNGTDGKVPCDIKMISYISDGSGGNMLNQLPNIVKGIEAHRKVEFVVSTDIVFSTKSRYADVVLPATTPWEQDLGGFLSGNPEMVLWYNQVIQPLFEAKDVQWMETELATRLGLDTNELYPISRKQQAFNSLASATVIKNDNSGYEPLVTITASDITNLGVEGTPQTGRISMQDLMSKGVYQIERSPGDQFSYIRDKEFIDDPVANPLNTPSGKYEIFSQTLSDTIKAFGWTTTPPIAQYRKPYQGYEDTFADWDNKIKGEYPLQLLTSHYFRRSHSVFDEIPQLRRAFPQEMWINTFDAKARGVKMGDTVLIRSRWGQVLRPAYVTDRIMPGVIDLGEGAWVDWNDDTQIDSAGATNTLSGTTPTGQGVQPWNTNNAQVEKWTGEPLKPDYTLPMRVPIEEA